MDKKILPPTKVYLDDSPVHGKGVFASQVIEEGEVIEECYILPLPLEKGRTDYNDFERDLFADYRFNWPHGEGWERLFVGDPIED